MQDTGKEKKSCFGCSVIAVCGWLVCAAMCLWLTISLEGYPKAYSLAYPAAMAVLFSNIFVFIFTSSRCAGDVRRLLPAVIRVCFGEGTMLLLVWLWGRYWLSA